MKRLRGMFILAPDALESVYGSEHRKAVEHRIDVIAPPISRSEIDGYSSELGTIDVLFSGWEGPLLDQRFLDASPHLKAVFYGGGSVNYVATPEMWARGVSITSAYALNAIPVAEYCMAAIVLSLKRAWSLARESRERRVFEKPASVPGTYGTTVGLVSLGMVGRRLRKLLRCLDVNVVAYDPYVSAEEAEELGVELVSMEALFSTSDVVSVHTPLLEETRGMIRAKHLARMPLGATIINTSRGAILRHDDLAAVFSTRRDLQAVLDVTDPEPLLSDSPLFDLPNVIITPHISGSLGAECRRMGKFMVEELERYLVGTPLHGIITPSLARNTCHRPLTEVLKPALA